MQSLSTLQEPPGWASGMQVPLMQRELLSQGAEVHGDPVWLVPSAVQLSKLWLFGAQ